MKGPQPTALTVGSPIGLGVDGAGV